MKKVLIPTIIASLLLINAPATFAKSFSDLKADDPTYLEISYLSEHKIINGYPDGSFRQNSGINRAELIKILIEASGEKITPPKTNCFPDVAYKEWYAPYVCHAKNKGYIEGYEDNTFRPEKPINKAETLKMMATVYGWKIDRITPEKPFNDVAIDAWYSPYVYYSKSKNFLPENTPTFNPGSSMTRGNFAKYIYRTTTTKKFKKEIFEDSINQEISKSLNIKTPQIVTQTANIKGLVTDSQNGELLKDVKIALYDNLDNFKETITSDALGQFNSTKLSYSLTDYLIFTKDGYFKFRLNATNIQEELHISLSRTFTTINPEKLRIVLTWGENDSDLDAHLLTPNEEEVFFMSKLTPNLDTILDLDSTKANGTETITIRSLQEGTYEYFVHGYGGFESFQTANARIEIYNDQGLAKIFYPPKDDKPIWKVFTLDPKGSITEFNEIGGCELIDKYSSICSN